MSWIERNVKLVDYVNPKDEKLNAYSHFLGLGLSLLGLLVTILSMGIIKTGAMKLAMVVYAMTNIILYTASGLYHYLPKGNAKRICRMLDHSSIYLLIIGTYTPILAYIGSAKTIWLLAAMYLVVAIGILCTVLFFSKLKALHIILYVTLGWLCVFFADEIFPFLPAGVIKYMFTGGIAYTVGLIFYGWKKMPRHHFIWHLFVLAGSLSFYFGIFIHLI